MALSSISGSVSASSTPSAPSASTDPVRARLQSALSQGQLQYLKNLFRHDVQQSFSQNKSIDDVAAELSAKVSSALQQSGAGPDETQSIIGKLNKILKQSSTRDTAKTSAQRYLDDVAGSLQQRNAVYSPSSEGIGELLDVAV